MKKPLENRFLIFLEVVLRAENIDSLEIPKEKETKQRADYFLANRQIIIEVKTLKSDTSYKIQEFVDTLRDRPDFPLFYGSYDINRVLKHLVDGDTIKKKIIGKITTSIEAAFKKADDQITDTKAIFNTPSSLGILVIINEDIKIFSPDIIVKKIHNLLFKRNVSGTLRYKQITCVWVVSSSHYFINNLNKKLIPSILIDGPTMGRTPELGEYIYELQPIWAEYEGLPLLESKVENFKDIKFKSFTTNSEEGSIPLPRQDLWRRQYTGNPYLSNLTEIEFLKYGAKAFIKLKPHFLIGREKIDSNALEQLMIIWSHFLEECKNRGTDMKKFYPIVEELESKLD